MLLETQTKRCKTLEQWKAERDGILQGAKILKAVQIKTEYNQLERLSDQYTECGGSLTVRLVVIQIFCVPREALLRRGATKNKSVR
jgi:hypothetical protein